MKHFLGVICFACSFLYADTFTIIDKSLDYSVINLNLGEISIEEVDGFDVIASDSKGTTQNIGKPQLPTYTFNYSVDYNKNYEVDLEVGDYVVYENINLLPVQGLTRVDQEKVFIKDAEFYHSDIKYPEEKIKLNRMSLRGYELLSVEIIPYEYNPKVKELKVFTNINIIISESGFRDNGQRAPRSQIFESMYKDHVINSDDYEDNRSFQKPSVLYICGGNIASSEYLEELTDWRHKQGYVVNVISSDDAGGSTSNIKNYILNAYNNWENPPEHVCLIGDANGSIDVPTYTVYGGSGWSTAQGEGDFPYSLLEGNDLLPEVTLGRISIRSTTELITAINKIIGYEKNYANDLDWLNAIALVGDPNDSGISTVITNQYIEQIVQIHGGITDIRTKYSGGSDYDDWMRNQINDGVAYLNYRGFYGFSGFTSTDVGQLNNGYKLPFIATLTCGTGSFATETTCMTESLYRAGTSVSPKGAVAVIGTAQSYTHTAFNNIVDMGIFEGLFINGVQTAGEAVVHGKLAINEIYPQNPNDNVYLFSTWNNLLGDPALQLWTSSPQTMVVQHNQMLINGSNNFQVMISDQQGNPIEGVMVTLSRDDQFSDDLFESVYTNSNGIADFSIISSMNSGTVHVVSRMQNYIPDESFFIISNDLPEVILDTETISIEDLTGNNDGYLNPGETASLNIEIKNNSDTNLEFIMANCTTNSPYITLSNNSNLDIGNLGPNESAQISSISISASNTMSDTDNPMVRLTVYSTSDDLLWNYIVPIDFTSANLELSYSLNSNLSVGESSDINFEIYNSGSMSLEGLTGEINYNGSLLNFNDDTFIFGSVESGENIFSTNSISVLVDNSVINGSVISVPVNLLSSNGYQTQSVLSFQVGNISVNDPVGPDMHGYYIYDIGDTGYELAPSYQWIEIDPDYGGNGIEVDIYDGGDNQDDVTTISLPFAFTFYGITYNSISICSNGWISFGDTDMSSFRNYTLPGPGGPSPMVAVFWDDLKTTNGGDVYYYHNQIDDSFIVEWSNVRTFLNNSSESFQVILYNSGNETPTGDDEIKMQYNNFNNTSIGNYPVGNYEGAVIHGQYCTVGIENHLASDGLEYTFNNTYAAGARILTDQSALFITTRGSTPYAQPEASYSVNEFVFNVALEEQYSDQLTITNNGEFGSELIYDIGSAPYPVNSDQIDGFGYAWTDSRETPEIINYDWINIENEEDLTLLEFENNDTATQINIGFDFPFYNENYTTCLVNPNGWIGFENDNDGWNNQAVFDEDSPNAAVFGFWDDLNPAYSSNELGSGEIKYHSDSNRLVVWFDDVIHWTDTDRVYNFQMIFYKSGEININYQFMQGDLESATIGIKSPSGNEGLEVVYNDVFVENNLSLGFNTSNWLSPDFLSGNPNQLSSGASATYLVNIDTNNLSAGVYYAYIVSNTNAPTDFDIIPVTLNAQSSFLYGDINQDAIIDVLDVVMFVTIVMGEYDPSSLEQLLGDLNMDGTINVQDIILLVNIILSN
mgnify:CR=1 FL=1